MPADFDIQAALNQANHANGDPLLHKAERSVIDATAYPILTEEIGYPPSPMSQPSVGSPSPARSGAGQGMGLAVANAVSDVLGWKANPSDPKGFLGALTQAFTLTEVEGRVESTWNPRTYTVQTDLAGGITGAQASLYTRARDAQDQCLPLLDGLYPLDPDADPEYVKALREMAKSQIVEIVKQFAIVPPSILRVNLYFRILLREPDEPEIGQNLTPQFDPDKIGGTLGHLRDHYGIWFEKSSSKPPHHHHHKNPFSNSVEDEQDITNFRVISDYMTSLFQSWVANRRFFKLATKGDPAAFLGTQLVLISRQFNVVVETVNEVRFTLDSVFIGPNERQQLLIEFQESDELPAMYLEDLLREIEFFMTEEGPRLIRDGGRIGVENNLIPVVDKLIEMIDEARPHKISSPGNLPDGYRTPRVRNSLDDLYKQLDYLRTLGRQVGMRIPTPLSLRFPPYDTK